MPQSTLSILARAAQRAAIKAVAKGYVVVTESVKQARKAQTEPVSPAEPAPAPPPARSARRRGRSAGAPGPTEMVTPELAAPVPAPRARKPRAKTVEASVSDKGTSKPTRKTRATATPSAKAGGDVKGEPAAKGRRGRPAKETPRKPKAPASEPQEVTAQPAFREPLLRAMQELDRPVTFAELTSHITGNSLVDLKPGDTKLNVRGRMRWEFIASKELGALRAEGKVGKEGDRWAVRSAEPENS